MTYLHTTAADCCARSPGKGTRTQLDRLVQAAIISCLVGILDNLGLFLFGAHSVPVWIVLRHWNGSALWLVKLNERGDNCFVAGGGVNRFIAAAIGGLTIDSSPLADSTSTGWRKLLVHPSPYAMRTLDQGGFSRGTPQGEARVSWRVDFTTSVVELELRVPPHAQADVHLPLLLDHEAAETTGNRRISVGACTVQCASDLGAAAAVKGDCEAYQRVRCEQRRDGEVVLAMTASSGEHSFGVHRA